MMRCAKHAFTEIAMSGHALLLLSLGTARAVPALALFRLRTDTIQAFGEVLLVGVGVASVAGLRNEFVTWIQAAFVTHTTMPI